LTPVLIPGLTDIRPSSSEAIGHQTWESMLFGSEIVVRLLTSGWILIAIDVLALGV
jgi:hypothetical protein